MRRQGRPGNAVRVRRHARARPREHVACQVVEVEAPSMRFASIGMGNMHTLTRLPRPGVPASVGKYSWPLNA